MLTRDKGWWWRGILLLTGLLFLNPPSGLAVQTTNVQDVVYRADGALAQGTLLVSWPAFTAADGSTVAAGSTIAKIANDGRVNMMLAPNAGGNPRGTYYTAVYHLNDGTVQKEYWVVPQTAAVTISEIRAKVVPAAVAQQSVSQQYVDTSISALQTSYLQLRGGTLSGVLNLAADPTNAMQAATKAYVDAHAGGAQLPPSQSVIAGSGNGGAVAMAEKGVSVSAGNGAVAWDEDLRAGRYDARNPKYAGGIYGTNPTAAVQAAEDQINCDMAMGVTAGGTLVLPSGSFPIGHIDIASGSYFGGSTDGISSKTHLYHTMNNVTMLSVNTSRTTTCSDGQQHTNGGTHTRVEHLQLSGCGQGGCGNPSGDTNSHPNGGPLDTGLDMEDSQGVAQWIGASNFGGTGIRVGGIDSQSHHLYTYLNNEWYLFGHNVAGQTYDPSTDGYHGDVELLSLDGQHDYIEVYGSFVNPGTEYGHLADILTGGGASSFSHLWPQLGEIGILQPYGAGANNRFSDFRVDFTEGDGILIGDINLTFMNGIVDGHCISSLIAARYGHCDALNIEGAGSYWTNVSLEDNPGFGPTYKTGDIYPFLGGTFRDVQGTYDNPPGYILGQGVDRTYANLGHPGGGWEVTGPAPDVSQNNRIRPVDTSPTTYTGVTNPFLGEEVWVASGDANVTLQGTASGGHFLTCNGGNNLNLGNPGMLHFTVTTGTQYGGPATLTQQCDAPKNLTVRPVPTSSAAPCDDADFTFGAGPASVGGFGIYRCHPANTWTFYPLTAVNF